MFFLYIVHVCSQSNFMLGIKGIFNSASSAAPQIKLRQRIPKLKPTFAALLHTYIHYLEMC
jgi:hypothetical protein